MAYGHTEKKLWVLKENGMDIEIQNVKRCRGTIQLHLFLRRKGEKNIIRELFFAPYWV